MMEFAAAALFGAAVGYATFLVPGYGAALAPAYGSAAGLVAFFLCIRALRTVADRGDGFRVATFAPRVLEFSELEELLLTDVDRVRPVARDELLLTDSDRLGAGEELLLTEADRLGPVPSADIEPLFLDDILAEIGPDSSVVRLFDRKAMPTPGEMQSRIDGHLQRGANASALPDASQALSEALAQLRRSLR